MITVHPIPETDISQLPLALRRALFQALNRVATSGRRAVIQAVDPSTTFQPGRLPRNLRLFAMAH